MVAQEEPEDQDASPEASRSQVSHFCAQLLPAGRVNGHSPLLQPPARHFQLHSACLAEPRRAKQKLNLSVMCSPRLHLFLLLFPTAGAPWRWAAILNRGEHHHNNLTPKQPMKLSSLQDTFPQTANTGPPELALRARLCIPTLKDTFPTRYFSGQAFLTIIIIITTTTPVQFSYREYFPNCICAN